MKGYRTFAFNIIMFAAAIVGVTVTPETANTMVELFAALWGGGNILLRGVTNTSIFEKK